MADVCRDLKLVHVHVLDLFGLDTEVVEGLFLGAVVEADHEHGQGLMKGMVLMVAPGLSQRMTSVVASKVDGLAPGLDLEIKGGHGEAQCC